MRERRCSGLPWQWGWCRKKALEASNGKCSNKCKLYLVPFLKEGSVTWFQFNKVSQQVSTQQLSSLQQKIMRQEPGSKLAGGLGCYSPAMWCDERPLAWAGP